MPDPPALRRPFAPTAGGVLVTLFLLGTLFLAPTLGPYGLYVIALVLIQVIAVLSLNLLMGYAGQVSLGQAAFVGMGAYGTAQFAAWGVPFPGTLVAGALATSAAAALVGLPALRIRGLHLAAATLAFGAAAYLLFSRPWDTSTSMGVSIGRPPLVLGDTSFLLLCITGLGLVLVLDGGIRHSRIGRAFFAVRDREDTAAARGIPVGMTKLQAYALSGLYAGIAGGLYAYLLERLTPSPFDVWTSLGYVAAVVVGGPGSWAGVAVAGATFTALPEVLRPAATIAPLIGAVLLMLVPVLRPEGLGWLLDRPLGRRRRSARTTHPPGDSVPLATLAPPRRALSLTVPVRTLLEVDDLHVRFGGLEVLRGVTMEVRRGELLGLIGPNGAGKSTLFNCLSGFVRPQQGAIRFRGHDLLALPAHARSGLGIGRTFQQLGLCPPQTVLENVLLAQHTVAGYAVVPAMLRAPSVRSTERSLQTRAVAALDALGVGALADERVSDLPHGEQRLVEIAAVLAAGPELLLLDEPAAGLSPEDAQMLGGRLRTLREELGVTIVLIEHHVPMVADVCDYVYVLAEMHVLAQGTPSQIQRDDQVIAVYLGTEAVREEVSAVA